MDYSVEHSLKDAGLELTPHDISKKDLARVLTQYFLVTLAEKRLTVWASE